MLAPKTIIVRSLDEKAIAAGRKTGVVGGTAWTSFGPLLVEAFETIAVANLRRSDEAKPSVLEVEPAMPGRNAHAGRLLDVVDGEAFDDDRRRNAIEEQVSGVNDGNPFARSEPQRPPDGLPDGGMPNG
jgi:hypothetical protein